MAHSSFQRQRCTVPALSCHGWIVHCGSWWNLEKLFSHIFHKSERDLEIPHRSWQTGGHPQCCWARTTSRTNTLFKQTTELYMLEVYDDLQSTVGQKRIFDQSPRLHRSRGRQQQTVHPIFEWCHEYTNTTTRTRKRTRTTVRTRSSQTSQRTTTMTCRERCFRRRTQQQRTQE